MRPLRDRHHPAISQNWIEAIKASREKCPMPITARHRLISSLDHPRSGLKHSKPSVEPPSVRVQIPTTVLGFSLTTFSHHQQDLSSALINTAQPQLVHPQSGSGYDGLVGPDPLPTSPSPHDSPRSSEANKPSHLSVDGIEPSTSSSSSSEDHECNRSAASRSQTTRPRLPPHRPVYAPVEPTVSRSTLGLRPRSIATAPTTQPHSSTRAQRQGSLNGTVLRRSQRKIAPPKEPDSITGPHDQVADLGKQRSKRRRAKAKRVPANGPHRQPLPSLQPLPLLTPKQTIIPSKSSSARSTRCPSPTASLRPFSNLSLSPRPQEQPSLDQLSFSDQPLSTDVFFHFPPPTPTRHPPPPYPGSPSPSPPSTHHPASFPPSYHSSFQQSPSPHYPRQNPPLLFLPSTYTPLQPSPGRIKRPLPAADRTENLKRTKKIKLRHLHFRSALVFSNLPLPLIKMPDSRLRATSPCFIPPNRGPRWLSSPASAEGRASRLCPNEGRWTGTGQGWLAHPSGGKVFYPWSARTSAVGPKTTPPPSSSSLTELLAPSPAVHLPRTQVNCYGGPRALPPRQANVSQAAPLKAQLLAILRMRSNMGPGEASLRFKKWVFWNAWTRREQQQQQMMYQRQLMIPPIIPPKVQVVEQAWTGNEVFDDNGDLIAPEAMSSEEEAGEEEEETPAQNVQTIILVAGHPTPPQSPVDGPSMLTLKPRVVSEVGSRKAEHQQVERPPTPPPSPPSKPSSNLVGCHA
ncbi:hypothetical protein CROQUDRAFT_669362 [Cronartium quercuum f. sp. fusiforme G11]|uniref:Uncharacterized protein n=1 Tax=Cronartium quercuum f. sp. fusiforme G11 TaxID=708437 RepID=A0A9P6NS34_9BASI|nr:hypothetical protein CROQUDRAFT_669362 [Cronartium quercuum f. sp. fusiforme G11]